MMLATGNVNSARLLLQRAAESGNGHAALILGDTYDADRLARIGAISVVPDRSRAAYWYRRADELGRRRSERTSVRDECALSAVRLGLFVRALGDPTQVANWTGGITIGK